MKQIKLTQGKFAQVDDSDFEYYNQWKWCVHKSGQFCYAKRNVYINGKYKTLLLHREIMNTPEGEVVDHIDFNGLNCLRANMRNCSPSQNKMNKRNMGESLYHGVSFWRRGSSKYIKAAISVNGQYIYLGLYKTEESAARAYDNAADMYFGEFANLNFK
jgi:hypothetical protein